MTRQRIEAEIVGVELDPFAGLRDALLAKVSFLEKQGLLPEGFTLVATDPKLHCDWRSAMETVRLTEEEVLAKLAAALRGLSSSPWQPDGSRKTVQG